MAVSWACVLTRFAVRFIAPKIFGAGALSWAGLDVARNLTVRAVARVGDDVLLTLRPSAAARGRRGATRRAR